MIGIWLFSVDIFVARLMLALSDEFKIVRCASTHASTFFLSSRAIFPPHTANK
jgi:hypothetical protein